MNNQLKNKLDKLLEDKADSLSGEVLSKLNQSRQVALSYTSKSRFNPFLWLIPLAATLVLSVYISTPITKSNLPANTVDNDGTLANEYTIADDMDVAEELDFYLWLAQQETTTS